MAKQRTLLRKRRIGLRATHFAFSLSTRETPVNRKNFLVGIAKARRSWAKIMLPQCHHNAWRWRDDRDSHPTRINLLSLRLHVRLAHTVTAPRDKKQVENFQSNERQKVRLPRDTAYRLQSSLQRPYIQVHQAHYVVSGLHHHHASWCRLRQNYCYDQELSSHENRSWLRHYV